MNNLAINVRADDVDGTFWIETRQTAVATAALWTALGLAREEPSPWMPHIVLCGEHGSGRSALARRFINAAQRNVACSLLAEADETVAARIRETDPDLERARAEWARRMVEGHGTCPAHCHLASWAPEGIVNSALSASHPAAAFEMSGRPDRDVAFLKSPIWNSPGNRNNSPTRRTSMVIVDDADRLLRLSPTRQQAALDAFKDFERQVRLKLAFVFIGTPALAQALTRHGTTQVIHLAPMPDDDDFATIVRMVFGSVGREEVTNIHRASGGTMGRVVHLARMQGLTPPFNVDASEIRRLPAPPSP